MIRRRGQTALKTQRFTGGTLLRVPKLLFAQPPRGKPRPPESLHRSEDYAASSMLSTSRMPSASRAS